jgi:hypothetical protein
MVKSNLNKSDGCFNFRNGKFQLMDQYLFKLHYISKKLYRTDNASSIYKNKNEIFGKLVSI